MVSLEKMFKKDDGGKPMVSLMEPEYILGTSKILTFGAEKYGKNNWKEAKDKDIARYTDALLRHLYAYLGGEKIDRESGQPHTYHISCNLMFLDYFDRRSEVEAITTATLHDKYRGDPLDILKD